jgi:AcrR family transcriptional regulator
MPDGSAPSSQELPPRRRLAPEARQPQILAAAFEEFAQQGYAGARMAGVAVRAGVAKGLVYHYFPSKPALFRAVVQAEIEPLLAEAERQTTLPDVPAAAMLLGLLDLAYAPHPGEGRKRLLFRLMLAEAERFPEIADWYEEAIFNRGVAIVRALLAHGAATGEFRPELATDPTMAEVLIGPAIAGDVWRMMMGDARAPARAAMRDAHARLLLAALRRDV